MSNPHLILTREKGESVVIRDDIRIVVEEVRGNKVKLGFYAPKEVPVYRSEIFDAIAAEHVANGTIALGEDQLDGIENQ